VGGWPSQENIDKITQITIWGDEGGIYGLQVTYQLLDGHVETVLHGKEHGDSYIIPALNPHEFFVGMNGAMEHNIDAEVTVLPKSVNVEGTKGKLRTLGFLVYNQISGCITAYGPFPVPDKSQAQVQLQGFAALGLLKGFTGTLDGKTKDLSTLAVYKVLAGELGWYGVSDTSNFDSK